MSILDQPIRSQICDLSEACGRYWELRGIAQEHRNEMKLELEQHLLQAAMDGKAPETVVSFHPAAFAEAWAREMHPHAWRAGELLLSGLVYALSVISTIALAEPFLAHRASFTLTLFTAFVLGGFGAATLLLPLAGFLALRIRRRTERSMLLAAVFVLGALVARLGGMRVNWSMPLLSWNWQLTILLATLTIGLASLECWRRASHEPLSSGRLGMLWRSLLLLAGNVVMFDLLLGMSSVVVFNVCMLTGRML
ncbi:hypothetical protein EPA93_10040 [Ktedonosporobacter rubrisoli]|uniref:Uncharacterized protein n=1 Tax=Ktedonosporobacter rubrisoli TaxID=2509675 RepID=A0A4P6JM59_KTERU|nr:hypothetical protein [Ktedonosporobacter rubrisoli]QBD76328.1 hypothetical protein EPA93_10040 [Ktedonosporobacter rubrisoli]